MATCLDLAEAIFPTREARLLKAEYLAEELKHAIMFHRLAVGLDPDFALLDVPYRSEEHTSELQSRLHLVCRLLLEKKKKKHSRKRHYQSVTDTKHNKEKSTSGVTAPSSPQPATRTRRRTTRSSQCTSATHVREKA